MYFNVPNPFILISLITLHKILNIHWHWSTSSRVGQKPLPDCTINSMRTKKYNYLILYVLLQNMETINQDILKIEKNMKNLIHQAGPLEGQLLVLLQSLPKPNDPPMVLD